MESIRGGQGGGLALLSTMSPAQSLTGRKSRQGLDHTRTQKPEKASDVIYTLGKATEAFKQKSDRLVRVRRATRESH